MGKLLTLDKRRRASFRKFGKPEHTTYAVTVSDNGVITMIPVLIIKEKENNHESMGIGF